MPLRTYKHDGVYYPINPLSLPSFYPVFSKDQDTVKRFADKQLKLQLYSIVYLVQKQLAELPNTRAFDYYVDAYHQTAEVSIYHWVDDKEPTTHFLELKLDDKKVVCAKDTLNFPFPFSIDSIQLNNHFSHENT